MFSWMAPPKRNNRTQSVFRNRARLYADARQEREPSWPQLTRKVFSLSVSVVGGCGKLRAFRRPERAAEAQSRDQRKIS
jgi:hypothetical protein